MDIQLYDKVNNPIEAIDQIGEFFAKSGMFGCERLEQGKVLAMVCLAERKSPVEISRTYHILDGKLSKKALAALAEFRSRGGRHIWRQTGDEPAAKPEDQKAVGYFKDRDGNELTYEYSLADAIQEQLVKKGSRWEKRPGNMLRARVISNALGMLCPELYAGDDPDTEPTAPASMDLGKAAETEPKPAKVDSVRTVKPTTGYQEPATTTANTVTHTVEATKAAEPERGPKPDPTDNVPMGNLSGDMVRQLEDALMDCGVEANKFFLQEGWLQKGQDWSFLTETRAKRILNQLPTFRARIGVPEQKGGDK